MLQLLIEAYDGETLEDMKVRSALTSAKRALREDARVWQDIASEIIAKYRIQ